MPRTHTAVAAATLLALPPAADAAHRYHGKMVATDAKDKHYDSVAWAKAHGMHDKGGDPLSVIPMFSLPKEAKESRAMHGARM